VRAACAASRIVSRANPENKKRLLDTSALIMVPADFNALRFGLNLHVRRTRSYRRLNPAIRKPRAFVAAGVQRAAKLAARKWPRKSRADLQATALVHRRTSG